MTTVHRLARFGATLALAFAIGVAVAPTSTFATEYHEEEAYTEDSYEEGYQDNDNDDGNHSVAPFVIDTVNGGVQTAAGATGFGLGVGAAASGNEGVGIGAGGTGVGAGVADSALGIPAGVLALP